MLDAVEPMGLDLPRFSLGKTDLPGIEAWDVGSQHYLLVKVEMTGKRNRKELPSKNEKVEADFRILSIRPLGKKPVNLEALERQDIENTIAAVKSGKA